MSLLNFGLCFAISLQGQGPGINPSGTTVSGVAGYETNGKWTPAQGVVIYCAWGRQKTDEKGRTDRIRNLFGQDITEFGPRGGRRPEAPEPLAGGFHFHFDEKLDEVTLLHEMKEAAGGTAHQGFYSAYLSLKSSPDGLSSGGDCDFPCDGLRNRSRRTRKKSTKFICRYLYI